MNSHSLEVKKEHKHENASLSGGAQAAITLSDMKQVTATWMAQPTLADGDCALHAIFGQPDSRGTYGCLDVIKRRQRLNEKVTECKLGDSVHRLALEGIKELVISKRAIGPKSTDLLDKHQQFLHEQSKLSPQLWEQFEKTLQQHPEVMKYIDKQHQHPKGTSACVRERFYDALTRQEGTLYGLIRSLPDLEEAFKIYNELDKTDYDWDSATPALLQEYASFIAQPGQWLLPSEVALIAEVFQITVEYYRHPAATKAEILNPGQSKIVAIRFDGVNHFERLIRAVRAEQKRVDPVAGKSAASNSAALSASTFSLSLGSNSITNNISTTSPVAPIGTSFKSTASASVRYPALRASLQAAYRDLNTLPMPLSERPFPIQEVSLTLNAKSVQAIKERELIAPIDNDTKDEKDEKKTRKEKKPDRRKTSRFGQEQLAREAAWHKIEKPILIGDIFKPITGKKSESTKTASEDKKSVSVTQVPDKPLKRILIEGRAGVGKTTLVQFIAWQWAEKGLFNSHYDYLLWIPLRQWLKGSSAVLTTLAEDLAAFLYVRYFKPGTPTTHLAELEAILSSDSSRTLLVLDGFDEVAHHLDCQDSMYGQLLRQALQFSQLIVTTRDYQLPPADIAFDNILVNIGFTDAQIEEYVAQYMAWKETPPQPDTTTTSTLEGQKSNKLADSSLFAALRGNPQLWAMAHIPLNIALICETQGRTSSPTSIRSSSKALADLTRTRLYQKVLESFLLRKLKKQGVTLKLYDMETLKRYFILEWDSLSTLAWEGFIQGEIVLSWETQQGLLNMLRVHYPHQQGRESVLERAFNLGLLRSEDPENRNQLDQPHYFIHLTFQEYFTAQYIVDTLQGYRGETLYQDTLKWVFQHKYDLHAAVVMGFIAGISVQPGYDQALFSFWHALLSPPHDVTGLSHLHLMLYCLEETRYDRRIPCRTQLLKEIEKWDKAFLSSGLSDTNIAAHAFWGLRQQYPQAWQQTHLLDLFRRAASYPRKDVRQAAIKMLGRMGTKLACQPEALTLVLKAVDDPQENVRCIAVWALGQLGTNLTRQPDALAVVLKASGDHDSNIRQAAIKVLDQLDAELVRQADALAIVLKASGDHDSNIRQATIKVLGQLGVELAYQPHALTAVLKAADDKVWDVRQEAVKALGRLGEELARQPKVLEMVLKAASSQEIKMQRAAIKTLGTMGAELARQPDALAAVLKAADDKTCDAQHEAVKALSLLGAELAHQPKALEMVLKAASSQEINVLLAAIKALGAMGTELAYQPDALAAVLKATDNKDINVQWAAREALEKMGPELARQPKTLEVVLKAASYQKVNVQRAAIEMLGKMGTELAQQSKALAAVLKAADDVFGIARLQAIKALSQLGIELARQPEALATILKAADASRNHIRTAAVRALGTMGGELARQPAALAAILKAAGDKDEVVQRAARETLEKMGAELVRQPETWLLLSKAVGDKNWYFRYGAIKVLGQLGAELAHQSDALTAVVKALDDKEWKVRYEAVEALGRLGAELVRQPEALTAVVKAAADKEEDVQHAAVKALGQLGAELTRQPMALVAILKAAQAWSKNIRQGAVKALGQLGVELARRPETLAAVLNAVWDKDRDVQQVAIQALGQMGTELARQPDALAAVFLTATHHQDWLVQKTARAVLQTHWGLFIHSAIRYYLSTELPSTFSGRMLKMLRGNPWQALIVSAFSFDFIPFSVSLIMGSQTLQILSDTDSESVELPSPTAVKPLIDAITQIYAAHQLILPDYTACVGEKLFYPHAKRPSFRPATWPKPRQLPADNKLSYPTLPLTRLPFYIEEPNRITQLKKQLKLVTSSPPHPQPKVPLPISSREAELHQQLMLLKQRSLLDQFLMDVQKMVQEKAKLHLHALSVEKRRTLTAPQVFLSYAWEEAGSARLKRLQEVFLRDTLATDLRCVGLSPWLDIERMVGYMDGQMRDNVTDSQFVLLIGTQRYAERTQVQKCGLLHFLPSVFKDKNSKGKARVENLPIDYNTFYLRIDKKLFYVSDKAKNQYKEIELDHEDDLAAFDRAFHLSPASPTLTAKQLTQEELATIRRITRHDRRANVRKELEFTLEQAKKGQREKINDFLLPLLLEGDWGTTFPEISKDYIVFDSRTWFSLNQGWLSFEGYIHGLTQLSSSSVGILPAVLGMSRTNDYPEYRKACEEAYKKLYHNLALKLHLLSLSFTDNKSSTTQVIVNSSSTRASTLSNTSIGTLNRRFSR